jgi:hypothetical protein
MNDKIAYNIYLDKSVIKDIERIAKIEAGKTDYKIKRTDITTRAIKEFIKNYDKEEE